jgi:hypothetical protein
MYRLRDTEQELAAALHRNTAAGELLFALRDPDPIDAPTVSALTGTLVAAAIKPSTYEVALAWIPGDVPVTAHFYINDLPITAASGTYRGGKVFFSIPDNLVVAPYKLTCTLRFWQGGWSYQLWGRVADRKWLLDSKDDPDPSSTDDDLVFRSVSFTP